MMEEPVAALARYSAWWRCRATLPASLAGWPCPMSYSGRSQRRVKASHQRLSICDAQAHDTRRASRCVFRPFRLPSRSLATGLQSRRALVGLVGVAKSVLGTIDACQSLRVAVGEEES